MASMMQWLSLNWVAGFIITLVLLLLVYLVRVSLCTSILIKKDIKSGGIYLPVVGIIWFILIFLKSGFYTEIKTTKEVSIDKTK